MFMSWTDTLTILIYPFHPPMITADGKQIRKTWEKVNSDVFPFALYKNDTHSELFNIL